MKKRLLITIFMIILAASAGAAVWYVKFREGAGSASVEGAAFVDSVATITGVDGSGLTTRFSGVVEPQKTVGVEVASGLKVKDTFVTVGQKVQVGTKLFSYDMDEAQDSITQLEIDIENYDIDIESTKAQIEQYEKERAQVSESEKRAYTTSIMTAENSIRRAEYNKKSKQAEMESLKKQVANAEVVSEMEGVVKSINRNNSGSDSTDGGYTDSGYADSDSDENANAYIVLMATGEYRVKGTVNEQNAQQLYEGMDVLVHSRVDESLIWKGTISTVDIDNPTQNQSSMYGMDNSMSSSSSYPFYVEMEDSTGLMLGQHVYVEPDNGQMEERTGIWLNEYYLITNEDGEVMPYVWAADEHDKLERRRVTLGEYDEDVMEYQILDGLTEEDYIAYPEEGYQEGMAATRNIDQAGGYEDEDGGEDLEDGYEEMYPEDADMEDVDMMEEDGGMDYMDAEMLDMDGAGEEFIE